MIYFAWAHCICYSRYRCRAARYIFTFGILKCFIPMYDQRSNNARTSTRVIQRQQILPLPIFHQDTEWKLFFVMLTSCMQKILPISYSSSNKSRYTCRGSFVVLFVSQKELYDVSCVFHTKKKRKTIKEYEDSRRPGTSNRAKNIMRQKYSLMQYLKRDVLLAYQSSALKSLLHCRIRILLSVMSLIHRRPRPSCHAKNKQSHFRVW